MRESPRPVRIRPATPDDAPGLAALARALVRAEGKGEAAHLTAEAVARWLSGPRPAFEALIAEAGGRPLGYLAYYHVFSLFKGGPVLLVENLFVARGARRRGIGRRLVLAAAGEARRRGLARIELNVRTSARSARRFYEGLGVRPAGETVYRIEDEALAALAARRPEAGGP